LLLYDWPLNVRELRSVARRLTMVEGDITMLRSAHLPKEIRRRVHMPTEDALRASAIQVHVAPSRHELQQMLEEYGGDVQKVAEHYAKDRRHVYRWLTRHDLSASDYRKPS
jgi:transcriptional regulator with PAS, ATPase and Fis domain